MIKVALSVVVPCYNEELTIRELHRRVTDVCVECVGSSYELVIVNDGSDDSTWKLMLELSSFDTNIIAVNLSRNYGHQIALSAGLQLCRGDRVFIIDADLQDPPELLAQMLLKLDAGCDVVFGQRTKREGETLFKRASASAFYSFLNLIVDVRIPRDTGDFRLMSRRAVDVLNSMPEQHRFIRGMVSWIGLRQEPLPYERAARFAGETKYPLSKMIRFAVDAITGFSIRPLRIASYLSFLLAFSMLMMLVYLIVNFFVGNPVEGWTSLAVIVLGLGSLQLFVAGIMGEYLGRMYTESKGRPLYVIEDVVCLNVVAQSEKSENRRTGL